MQGRRMNRKYVLGIDIGGTNLRMGIVDNACRMKVFERVSAKEKLADQPISNLINLSRDFLNRTGMAGGIEGIAVGIPAAVSQDHSFVYSVPNLQVEENVDWGRPFAKAMGVPVFVDRDVNYIVIHDIIDKNLDPDHSRTVLGFYLGTGLGNAVYINGKLYFGKHGMAGELGHIPLYGVDEMCTCGLQSCVETRVSGRYLEAMTAREFPDCYIADVFLKHGDDPRLLKFVHDTALPIATEITLLDPDYIILGGGVISMPGFPVNMLKEKITQMVRRPLPAADLHFIVDADCHEKGVLGGALTVFSRLGISVER